jgi:hypothetical protein
VVCAAKYFATQSRIDIFSELAGASYNPKAILKNPPNGGQRIRLETRFFKPVLIIRRLRK